MIGCHGDSVCEHALAEPGVTVQDKGYGSLPGRGLMEILQQRLPGGIAGEGGQGGQIAVDSGNGTPRRRRIRCPVRTDGAHVHHGPLMAVLLSIHQYPGTVLRRSIEFLSGWCEDSKKRAACGPEHVNDHPAPPPPNLSRGSPVSSKVIDHPWCVRVRDESGGAGPRAVPLLLRQWSADVKGDERMRTGGHADPDQRPDIRSYGEPGEEQGQVQAGRRALDCLCWRADALVDGLPV